MSFTSPLYYIFLALSLIIYFNVPVRFRGYLLLFSSYIFYTTFNPRYIAFILTTTVVSFFCARTMMLTRSNRTKNLAMALALAVELAMLGFTKYWNAVADSTHLISAFEIMVPLGISFYTFQSIGYLCDVYRDEIKAELNFGRYALFISFFPHLLAGPIEPSQHFLPQIQKDKFFSSKAIAFGIMLIVIGLFKKLVIADRLGPVVHLVFDSPGDHYGSSIAFATLLARYQIYCDFSGYTDIALGSAMMFGYQLTINFNRPFFSKSISEYWQRWHMSLTNWIRTYVFYPLLTSPFSVLGFGGLIIITFLTLGLWHGLTINFLLYGLLQGLLILIDAKTKHWRQRFYERTRVINYPRSLNCLSVLITFFILVVPPTLLFRSHDFLTSQILIKNLFLKEWSMNDLSFIFKSEFLTESLTIAFTAITLMEMLDWIQKKKMNIGEFLWSKSKILFYILIFIGLVSIVVFGKFDQDSRFIYMQF